VDWKGLEIHPEVPKTGLRLSQLLGPGRLETVWANVDSLAGSLGLKLKRPHHLPNSHWSLEAAEFAKKRGRLKEFHDLVFKAYFEEDQDIGSLEVLAAIAQQSDLDSAELKESLQAGHYYSTIEQYRQEARAQQVTGVPTYIIGEYPIVGAQPYEIMKRAADKALENMQPKETKET
jgi:predicted DsbA family dithiol-disulfide isomerase